MKGYDLIPILLNTFKLKLKTFIFLLLSEVLSPNMSPNFLETNPDFI